MNFLAPAFLAGLAAIAIPVIIHMINRERKVVVEFPSLMFLERIPYKSVRRQKIRHLLLLILRCLAIALLVAAFARFRVDPWPLTRFKEKALSLALAIGRTDPGVVGLAAGGGAAAGAPGFDGLRDAGDAVGGALDAGAGLAGGVTGFPGADRAAGRALAGPPPTAGGTAVIAGGRGGATGFLGAAGVGAGAGVSCTWSASP